MFTTARIVCTTYTVVLSAGLLTPQGGRIGGFIAGLGDHPDLQHFLAFTVLAWLCGWAAWPVRILSMAIALVSYAFGTELLQGVIPGRSADLWDVLANLLGLTTGAVIWIGMRRLRAGREQGAGS